MIRWNRISINKIGLYVLGVWMVASFVASPTVMGFAKKRPQPPAEPPRSGPPPEAPDSKDTQAFPTRLIRLGNFLETSFLLPDGATRVDMSTVLPQLVLTTIQQTTKKFRVHVQPTESSADNFSGSTDSLDVPQGRFVFRGGLTSFEAENFSASITFGYKPGVGDIGHGTLRGVDGKLTFSIGSLGLDFYIVDTERNEVVAVGQGDASPTGTKLEVDLDFNQIHSGADLVFRSALAPLFRKAASRAIEQMVEDPQTNFLMDWTASVIGLNRDSKQLILNSGRRDNIEVNNVFSIYNDSKVRIGEAKVRAVDHESSAATYKNDTNGKDFSSTREGDTVKIYFKE